MLIPYFNMAIRSIPIPKARPEYSFGSIPEFFQDLVVYDTAAENLDPAGVFAERAAFSTALEAAYIDLNARLREREISSDGDVS